LSGRRTILIADDAAVFRELGALFLARSGRVVTANNGYEALELALRERPAVVVADLDMPCLGGDGLCLRIKQDPALRDTPVVLVVPGDLAEDRERAVRAGADDVIAKPISRLLLIQTVNRFLRGGARRAQARVAVETRVQIRRANAQEWGTARNLSRGGIFVEAEAPVAPGAEVALEFTLPETSVWLSPTAEVVWRRESHGELPAGIGLRFLALDGASARQIDSYVYERARQPGERPLAPAGGAR
jgi:uncharacterized protein (TIGR02266 family)